MDSQLAQRRHARLLAHGTTDDIIRRIRETSSLRDFPEIKDLLADLAAEWIDTIADDDAMARARAFALLGVDPAPELDWPALYNRARYRLTRVRRRLNIERLARELRPQYREAVASAVYIVWDQGVWERWFSPSDVEELIEFQRSIGIAPRWRSVTFFASDYLDQVEANWTAGWPPRSEIHEFLSALVRAKARNLTRHPCFVTG